MGSMCSIPKSPGPSEDDCREISDKNGQTLVDMIKGMAGEVHRELYISTFSNCGRLHNFKHIRASTLEHRYLHRKRYEVGVSTIMYLRIPELEVQARDPHNNGARTAYDKWWIYCMVPSTHFNGHPERSVLEHINPYDLRPHRFMSDRLCFH